MEGHYLLIKRVLFGVVTLSILIAVGYAAYSFYFAPAANYSGYSQAPSTPEEKLKTLDDLLPKAQSSADTSATVTSDKAGILNSLTPASTQGADTGTAPVTSSGKTLTPEEIAKLKILESLQKKTQ